MKKVAKTGLPILSLLLFLVLLYLLMGIAGIIVPLCIMGIGYLHHTK